ncbi:MAG: amine dehydrogenase large subunit [Gluconacetobacter sp.]
MLEVKAAMSKKSSVWFWLAGLALLPVGAWADDAAFVPEVVSVKERMSPGPNVFVNQMDMATSTIYIFSTKDLTLKGNVSGGSWGLATLSRDGNTAYMASGFLSRVAYGTGEDVLQIFDVPTNTVKKEIILPYKLTQYTPDAAQLRLSADEKFIYIQNATPATSVTVVDLEKGKVVKEIPSPGCYGIYPMESGYGYSAICSDGSFATFKLSPDGQSFTSQKSEKIFDVDEDPIFLASARVDSDLVFLSYNGNLYRVSDASGVIRKVDVIAATKGVPGSWGASGYGVMSYDSETGIMFMAMSSNRHEGTHHHGATEIWAYDMKKKKIVSRSPVKDISTIGVVKGEQTNLFGLDIKKNIIVKYDINPKNGYSLKPSAQRTDFGFATMIMGAH